MRFRYLGDKDDMTAFGYSFAGGNEPDVTEPHAVRKLSNNPHFEAVIPQPVSVPPYDNRDPQEFVPKVNVSELPAKNKGGRPRKVQPTEA